MLSACTPPPGFPFPVSSKSLEFLELSGSDSEVPARRTAEVTKTEGQKRSFLVPEKFSLPAAVSAARDGDEILLQDGEYELSSSIVLSAAVSIAPLFKGSGSRVCVRGGWLLRSKRGGSLRGLTCINQDSDCIRVEEGKWQIQDCALSCGHREMLAPATQRRNSSALWCGGGEVTLQNCVIGSHTRSAVTPNGLVTTGSAAVVAKSCRVHNCFSAVAFGDASSIKLMGCTVLENAASLTAGRRSRASLSASDCKFYDNAALWAGTARPVSLDDQRNTDDKGSDVALGGPAP